MRNNIKSKKIIIWLLVLILVATIITATTFLLCYPTKYKSEIKKYCKQYELNPSMVASVIKIESNYNSTAISQAGAIGLMQIMPTTAVEVANKLGIEFEVDDLFDIDTNINIGCYYLKYLLDIFDGNMDNALSAYNWGLSNVKTWILKGNTDGYGNITNIPVRETENYLKKYRRAKTMYTNIFGYDV